MTFPFIILSTTLVALASITDLRGRQIPNRLLAVFLLLGLICAISSDTGSLMDALVQGGVVGLVFIPFFLLRGMGGGDVKLFIVLGFLLDQQTMLAMVLFSMIFGGVFALALEFVRWAYRRFLPISSILVSDPYEVSEGLPFACPIALGTLLAHIVYGHFDGFFFSLLNVAGLWLGS